MREGRTDPAGWEGYSLGRLWLFRTLALVFCLFSVAAVLGRAARSGVHATHAWWGVAVFAVVGWLLAWAIFAEMRGRYSPAAPRMGWGEAVFFWSVVGLMGGGCLVGIVEALLELGR